MYSTTQAPSFEHFFGTDAIGRDVFIRVLVGGQILFEVAIVMTIVSVVIGNYGEHLRDLSVVMLMVL